MIHVLPWQALVYARCTTELTTAIEPNHLKPWKCTAHMVQITMRLFPDVAFQLSTCEPKSYSCLTVSLAGAMTSSFLILPQTPALLVCDSHVVKEERNSS